MLLSRSVAWRGQGKSQTQFFSGAKGGQLPPILATIFFNRQKKGQESSPPKIWPAQKLCFVWIVPVVFWAISCSLAPFFYVNKNAAPAAIGHPRRT